MKTVIQQLELKADPFQAQKMSNYMKHIMPFRGVMLSDLNLIVKEHWKSDWKNQEFDHLEKLGCSLIEQKYGEEKWVGTYLLGKLVNQMKLENIQKYEQLFIDDHIKGWAAVDNFSSKILQKWIQKDIDRVRYMLHWADSDNLWMRRASCVGLLHLGKKCDKEILDVLFEVCQKNIIHQERFNQLGCGWLLRYMSLNDFDRVVEFINSNIQYFTGEGLRYAYEKMKNEDQEILKECLKEYKKETKEFEKQLRNKKLLK